MLTSGWPKNPGAIQFALRGTAALRRTYLTGFTLAAIERFRRSSRLTAMGSFGGEHFDRPKTSHPIDHYAEREAHISHLNMILRLLRAREQARGQ